jgi:hypothetical protein
VRSPDIAGDPISLVAAEIHRGHWLAVITGGWPKSSIQVMCQCSNLYKIVLKQSDKIIAMH